MVGIHNQQSALEQNHPTLNCNATRLLEISSIKSYASFHLTFTSVRRRWRNVGVGEFPEPKTVFVGPKDPYSFRFYFVILESNVQIPLYLKIFWRNKVCVFFNLCKFSFLSWQLTLTKNHHLYIMTVTHFDFQELKQFSLFNFPYFHAKSLVTSDIFVKCKWIHSNSHWAS